MANITAEQLTQYDSRIKQYITTQIQNAVSGYSLQIAKLNNDIDELKDVIEKQQSLIDSMSNNVGITEDSQEEPTPILRSALTLRSISPASITVQEDIQEDYVVYDRVIRPNDNAVYKNIVVTSDNKSNRVWFSMWKTFDNRPLIDKEINVVWINASGNKGESVCNRDDISIIGDRLYFAWDIPIEATQVAGTITYAIRIVDGHTDDYGEYVEDYAWHTLPATIECVQGLVDENWDNLEEAEVTPGWVDYIEGKYKISITEISKTDYTNLSEKDENTLYLVDDDSKISMYFGTTPIISAE